MLIAKTQIERKTLVALQKRTQDTTRTHDNDLVALEYAFNSKIDARQALDSQLASIIYYSFVWVMPCSALADYVSPNLQIKLSKFNTEDGPTYVAIFTGTIRDWLVYCNVSGHPEKFVKTVKEQLSKDGYSLKLT